MLDARKQRGERMSIEGFLIGFAVLIAGAIVSEGMKNEFGRLILGTLTTILGIFGVGYWFGFTVAASEYWRSAYASILDVSRKESPEIASAVSSALGKDSMPPELTGWLLVVSGTMATGGLLAMPDLIAAVIKKLGFQRADAPKSEPAKQAKQKPTARKRNN